MGKTITPHTLELNDCSIGEKKSYREDFTSVSNKILKYCSTTILNYVKMVNNDGYWTENCYAIVTLVDVDGSLFLCGNLCF